MRVALNVSFDISQPAWRGVTVDIGCELSFLSLSLSLRLQNPFGDVLIKTIAHAFHFVTLCSSVQAEQTNKLFIRHLIEIAALVSVLHSIITATFINIYGNFTHATHTNIDFSKFFGWVFHE